MMTPLRALLERAEFDVIEASVQFHEGAASPDEVSEATERLRRLHELASSLEQDRSELFAFPRHPEAPAIVAGH
jgi:hypothetical protein